MFISIRQLGGHKGSFAGDCAIIEIESGEDSHVLVIDTGSSTIWRNPSEFKNMVKNALPKRAMVPRSLITTHFHADHFTQEKLEAIKWTNWWHGEAIRGTPTGGTLVTGCTRILTGRDGDWQYFVDCYAPSWTGATPGDENDLSLAIAVYASNGVGGFAFLTCGDMTPEAEARLTALFFPVCVAKFPHHGSPSNYLKYFSYGIADTVLISGDSGNAADVVKKLLGDNSEVKVRVLARTTDASEYFKNAWMTACSLNSELYKADVQVGKDIVIGWASGDSDWGELASTDLSGAMSLSVATKQVSKFRKESTVKWQ